MQGLPGAGVPTGGRGTVRIAVDAMGGEGAPQVEVEGALEAAAEADGAIEVVLVGRQDALEAELAGRDVSDLPISVAHAGEVIAMGDSPATAVRTPSPSPQ